MVPIVHEPPGRYDVIIRVARDGGQLPDPVTFAVAADQAASRRSASIISVHTAGTIINVVSVTAPGRYAALAVARAVVSDALKAQAPSPTQLAISSGDGRVREMRPVRVRDGLGPLPRPGWPDRPASDSVQGPDAADGWLPFCLVLAGSGVGRLR